MNDFALYLPDGDTATLWGAAVTACGLIHAAPGSAYPPQPGQHPGDHLFGLRKGRRILESYQIIYISSGCGRFESAVTGEVEIGNGSAFLLFPNVWHRYAPHPQTGWTEHFIEMTGPTLDRLKKQGVLRPQNAVFTPGESPQLIEAFGDLGRLALEGRSGNRIQMAMLGMYLLAQVIYSNHEPGATQEERAVRHAEARLREELGERLKMKALALEFGVPYDRFRRRFKALTGLAPKQYHRKLQMRRAQERLLYTEHSLGEIAEELGFDSAFHFSAAFKEHSGQAPSHWRNAKRESARHDPGASSRHD
jgi:AraC-like DNA-binding protein